MFEREKIDRVVDVASVVLISVAAVLSALCGYQSGRWGGAQAHYYSVANASRIESAEASDRQLGLTAIDVNLFLHYVDAVDAGNAKEARFIYKRLRPEMRPAMKAWLATKPQTNPHAPSTPFVMPQYREAAMVASRQLAAAAEQDFKLAETATHHSDEFLLLTVVFAGVSFLAGISTKMLFPRHAIIVGVGSLALIYGLARITQLPFL